MTAPAWTFGLAGFGHALAEPCDVAAEAARYLGDDQGKLGAWGYRTFHRADDGTGLTDFAVHAGAAALESAGVSPADVDLVVLAIADVAEYLYWDPAAAVQARLGAHHAEAVLLNQACGGGVMAFDAVAGKFATHPEYATALVVAANRVCEAYWNRMASGTSVGSDGAAAAVAIRGGQRLRWLCTEVVTDGRYADFTRLPVGGASRPFAAGGPTTDLVSNPFDRLAQHFTDVRSMAEFADTVVARNRDVLERACKRAGIAIDDIRYVLHLNDNLRALRDLSRRLGVPLERTNAHLAMEHGHLGTADQLLALAHLEAGGQLEPGQHVALTSMSSGMHWAATLLRV